MKPHELADKIETKKTHIGGYYVSRDYILQKLDKNTIAYRRIKMLTHRKLGRNYVVAILRDTI